MQEGKKPLRAKVAKHGNFYIRYDVAENEDPDGSNYSLDVDIYETIGWTPSGEPVFYGSVETPTCIDPSHDSVKAFMTLYIKWDGCTHIWMPNGENFHFDEWEEFDALRDCIRYIYHELCEENRVVD